MMGVDLLVLQQNGRSLGWVIFCRTCMSAFHLSLWRQNALVEAGTPEGEGVSIAGSHWFEVGNWSMFALAGWARGGISTLQHSASLGVTTHSFEGRDDYTGLSVAWGQAFDTDEDQFTTEAFYRFDVNDNFAITPSIQHLANPANNPETDSIWIAGLRLRANF